MTKFLDSVMRAFDWPPLRWALRVFTAVFVIHMLWTGRWITVLVLTVVGVSIGVGVAIIQERLQEKDM